MVLFLNLVHYGKYDMYKIAHKAYAATSSVFSTLLHSLNFVRDKDYQNITFELLGIFFSFQVVYHPYNFACVCEHGEQLQVRGCILRILLNIMLLRFLCVSV